MVAHLTLWSLDLNLLANLESIEVFGNVAVWVRLDDEVKETQVVIGRGGGVGSLDVLSVDFGLDGNVLADGQSQDGSRFGKTEAVEGGVVADLLALDEVEPLPDLGV